MAAAVPVTSDADASKARRLGELREFLMSRRARVSPAEAGLPDGGARRRTPGLRREEVAVLAGVGASWYQWLEQGRDISVSPQVLDSVARVLKLSGAERRHLYVLSGLNPPRPEVARDDQEMCEGLHRLIDTWMPQPAHIMDAYWNCVMYNDAAASVLGMRSETSENCLLTFFTDPIYRARARSWQRNAPQVVAMYRAACSEHPDDDGFAAVIAGAKSVSSEFVELWERRDILPGGQVAKEIEHPVVGTLFLESTQLKVPARPDLTIVLHTPMPDAEVDTAGKLAWLASPEGRRGSIYPVAG
ncbi:helix-turn-helix transcriptional regulator [Streptomyces sp. Je 1-369]|uniref:helix-turn-helix transcriptional regulator n=1 Tax=Streptomyces sp. Je 1-369 TaxID=2966192 RepID=UPI0022862A20|nr:helix-turn-helix transcriptional regulator [Streptomyces sp. Je 1-369]WAL95434.1 helix-turn-helix transcriptional regulator [Streptomyces sp. Je 1-369]